jgi:hypothetical protein
MTKVISVVIIVLVIAGVWEMWEYWDRVSQEKETAQKQAVATAVIPEQLAGLPKELETSLQAAKNAGSAVAMRNWLKRNVQAVQDPRRAWIELDYMISIARDEPVEARKIFADVKNRTPETSPVYPRIKQLEKTYE